MVHVHFVILLFDKSYQGGHEDGAKEKEIWGGSTVQEDNGKIKSGSDSGEPLAEPSLAERTKSTSTKAIKVLVGEFDYEKELEDELSFKAGDRMVIIAEAEDDGW